MLTKIDWISFSFPADFPEGLTNAQLFHRMDLFLANLHGLLPDLLDLRHFTLSDKGRAPYKYSYRHPSNSIVVFFGVGVPHALVEISGQGCDWLEGNGQLLNVLALCKKRLTRLDIATDILTAITPLEFVAQREETRFRTHSEFVSETGTTCYIGSRTSNRYARVYRYNPPHERAHLLRIEYVVKAEDAKATAQAVLESNASATANALGDAFGWQHSVYDTDAPETPEIAVWRAERHEGKTLYWLADTVAPLLVRLQREGILDATQWLHDNVLSKLPKPPVAP